MRVTLRAALFVLVTASMVPLAVAQREADPNSPRFKAVMALQEMIESEGDEPLRLFIKEKMAPVITDAYPEEDLMEMLRTIRKDFSVSPFEGALPKGPYTVIMTFGAADAGHPSRLTFEIEAEAPYRLVYIDY